MTPKKNEFFPFAQFDFSQYGSQYGENYRAFVEKAIAQSTDAYDKFKAVAEEATAGAQTSFNSMRESFASLTAKAIDNTRVNTEAGVAFLEKLASAKSLSEVIDLQSAYFRSAFETLTSQAKEAQEMAVKASDKASAPVKSVAQKMEKVVKTAA